MVKYPKIEVPLVGEDGNAFIIIARVSKALKRGGVSEAEIKQFRDEAMSGDYYNVLTTTMDWVSVR